MTSLSINISLRESIDILKTLDPEEALGDRRYWEIDFVEDIKHRSVEVLVSIYNQLLEQTYSELKNNAAVHMVSNDKEIRDLAFALKKGNKTLVQLLHRG